MLSLSRRERASYWAALIAAAALWLLAFTMVLPGCCSTRRELPAVNQMLVRALDSVVYVHGQRGSGSGFVVYCEPAPPLDVFAAGKYRVLVMTAGHCLDLGGPVLAETARGKRNLGELDRAWRCPSRDLGLMEFDVDVPLPVLPMRQEPLRLGEHVWLTGFPLGLQAQITQGYVGDPALIDLPGFLDEPAENGILPVYLFGDPGNSGSCVLDDAGEVVGVLTIGWNDSHGANGIVALAAREPRDWISKIFALDPPYWDSPPPR